MRGKIYSCMQVLDKASENINIDIKFNGENIISLNTDFKCIQLLNFLCIDY